MAKLTFTADEVRRVTDHALAAPRQRETWNGVPTEPCVLFVHDQGVYLMSNGEPPDPMNGCGVFCAYAEGCNPNRDKDWYQTARQLVGGDDFAESLPAETIKLHLHEGVKSIRMDVTDDSISVYTI